jgi:hypothetical protein
MQGDVQTCDNVYLYPSARAKQPFFALRPFGFEQNLLPSTALLSLTVSAPGKQVLA